MKLRNLITCILIYGLLVVPSVSFSQSTTTPETASSRCPSGHWPEADASGGGQGATGSTSDTTEKTETANQAVKEVERAFSQGADREGLCPLRRGRRRKAQLLRVQEDDEQVKKVYAYVDGWVNARREWCMCGWGENNRDESTSYVLYVHVCCFFAPMHSAKSFETL